MARIKLLKDIQTERLTLEAGREVLCNWPDAVRMERYGLAVILLPQYDQREATRP